MPGEVIVQTCTPEHPAIAAVAAMLPEEGEREFRKRELAVGRDAGYPPFTRLVTLLEDGPDAAQVEAVATELAAHVRESAGEREVIVLGPAPQPLARLRGRHRWHILLKGTDGMLLRDLAACALALSEVPDKRTVRVIADVDPIEGPVARSTQRSARLPEVGSCGAPSRGRAGGPLPLSRGLCRG